MKKADFISITLAVGAKLVERGEKRRTFQSGNPVLREREYDAELGRWNVVDKLYFLYPGKSPYNYCLNSPMNVIDPNGLKPLGWVDPFYMLWDRHLNNQYQNWVNMGGADGPDDYFYDMGGTDTWWPEGTDNYNPKIDDPEDPSKKSYSPYGHYITKKGKSRVQVGEDDEDREWEDYEYYVWVPAYNWDDALMAGIIPYNPAKEGYALAGEALGVYKAIDKNAGTGKGKLPISENWRGPGKVAGIVGYILGGTVYASDISHVYDKYGSDMFSEYDFWDPTAQFFGGIVGGAIGGAFGAGWFSVGTGMIGGRAGSSLGSWAVDKWWGK